MLVQGIILFVFAFLRKLRDSLEEEKKKINPCWFGWPNLSLIADGGLCFFDSGLKMQVTFIIACSWDILR
jgi:hypothetical protein